MTTPSQIATIDLQTLGRATLFNAFRNSGELHHVMHAKQVVGMFVPVFLWDEAKDTPHNVDPDSREPALMKHTLRLEDENALLIQTLQFVSHRKTWCNVLSRKGNVPTTYGVFVSQDAWHLVETTILQAAL